MSVGLFRLNGDIDDPDSKITFSKNVSTEEFYHKYWEKGIEDVGIKIFKDGSQFNKSQLNDVLIELEKLKIWATKNLTGVELTYMKERIEYLQEAIPNAFIDDKTILYIF